MAIQGLVRALPGPKCPPDWSSTVLMDARQGNGNDILRLSAAEKSNISPVEALKAMGPGDTTGSETLERYHYQCKVAVQRWLAMLISDADYAVVCEYIDDITIVTASEILFSQVKTRDRGAWTASIALSTDGGLGSLVRSYNHAKDFGCIESVRLELILEGPEGSDRATRRFFDDPIQATESQRNRLVSLGLDEDDTNDFLSRLAITPGYCSRQTIDAVTLKMLMTIVASHSSILETLYDTLLQRAIDAHSGLKNQGDLDVPLVLRSRVESESSGILERHALTRSDLLDILPLTPNLATEQRRRLERASEGTSTMSDLEFKLRMAGANEITVARAKTRRAEASAVLASRPTLSSNDDSLTAQLRERLLEHADGVVADIVATASPAVTKLQPAEAVWGRLLQQLGLLGDLDAEGVFDGDGSRVLGYLCHLSDECLFAWRLVS